MTTCLELPWPPSVNHYYRYVGPRVLISREGRRYREKMISLLQENKVKTYSGPVDISIEAYPPDNRRRDVDNLLKSLLDAFTHGGLVEDDSQVCSLMIKKRQPMPPEGMIYMEIKEYDEKAESRRTLQDNPKLCEGN